MDAEIEEDALAHYGVKGMQWGVRKRGPMSQDAAKVKKLRTRAKKQGLQNLQNKEIQKINERLQLERKYRDLKRETSTLTRGQKAVAVGLSLAGTAASVYALKDNPAVKAGIAALRNTK